MLLLWVPFRSPTFSFALKYWRQMFLFNNGGIVPVIHGYGLGIFYAAIFVVYSLVQGIKKTRIADPARALNIYYYEAMVYFLLIIMMPGVPQDFIYFQF